MTNDNIEGFGQYLTSKSQKLIYLVDADLKKSFQWIKYNDNTQIIIILTMKYIFYNHRKNKTFSYFVITSNYMSDKVIINCRNSKDNYFPIIYWYNRMLLLVQ